jgi:DNA (cytosine-5)-methyltransferase 1
MIYGSICSGIEAATVAWHPLGWRPAFFSEIDEFPRAVLRHHYPQVPLHGDFTEIQGIAEPIRLLVGGTPCQSFSLAGLRGGLADGRGNLALEHLRLADRLRPHWFLWENVPGALSTNGGRDFGAILGGLAELGYGWAYRILDAQYVRVDGFGRAVPQRRRRVFVVGCLGGWTRAAAVLFERASLQGNPPPRRQPGARVAGTLAARTRGGGGLGSEFESDGGLVAVPLNDIDGASYSLAAKLTASGYMDASVETFIGEPQAFNLYPVHGQGRELEASQTETSPSLTTVATGGPSDRGTRIVTGWRVRRLTPRECERLQGFPDDYTDVPYRGRRAKDGPRYKAIGNSMACNVMRWIGARIQWVEDHFGEEPEVPAEDRVRLLRGDSAASVPHLGRTTTMSTLGTDETGPQH